MILQTDLLRRLGLDSLALGTTILYGLKNDTKLPKGPFTKDVPLTAGEGGLRNPDVQLLFEYIVYPDAGGKGGLEILVLDGRPL